MASPEPSHYAYRTAHGAITVGVCDGAVTCVAFGNCALPGARRPSALSNRTATQLQEYFAGKRRTFDLPLAPQGTEFQKRVWDAMARIPYGEARTAAELARSIGSEGAHRAVGTAVRRNPLAVVVPGHRVVTAAGKPWGAGREAQLRGALLRIEQERLKGSTTPT